MYAPTIAPSIGNTSLIYGIFTQIYGDDADVAVPYLQVMAMGVLFFSASVLVLRLKYEQRRSRARAHQHAWELLSSDDPTPDVALRVHLSLALALWAFSALALVLMCVPIVHDGWYVKVVYVCGGLLDIVPIAWAMQRVPTPTTLKAPAAIARRTGGPGGDIVARALVLFAVMASCRTLAVAGQEMLTPYLYVFGPTSLALYVNFAQTLAFLLHYAASCHRHRWLVRSQCRPWLLFLATCYGASSLGYVLLQCGAPFDEQVLLLTQWVAMILYDSLLAPALYHNYLNERRYWQVAPLHRRLAIEAEVRASLNGAGGAPLLAVPPGTLPVDGPARERLATVARDALETTRQIGEDELVLHDVIGTGGFAEVYRATWTPKQSAPPPEPPLVLKDHSTSARPLPDADDATAAATAAAATTDTHTNTASSSSDEGASGAAAAGAEATMVVEVAAKRMKAVPQESAAFNSFCREIALMAKLRHPNVLRLLGVCVNSHGALTIVTDLMPRGSLFQLLHERGAPPPLPTLLGVLRDAARGMAYLHERQVVHRDLKSQNLLVDWDWSVRVADFGLSRECLTTGTMTRVGSVQWAAPEVLLGHGYSHKCDLWSFGVVCWETMTARVPFDGMSQVLVATRVALEGMRLPVPADAPMPLLRLMARCWAEVPALRPDFSEVLAELQALAKVGEVGHAVN